MAPLARRCLQPVVHEVHSLHVHPRPQAQPHSQHVFRIPKSSEQCRATDHDCSSSDTRSCLAKQVASRPWLESSKRSKNQQTRDSTATDWPSPARAPPARLRGNGALGGNTPLSARAQAAAFLSRADLPIFARLRLFSLDRARRAPGTSPLLPSLLKAMEACFCQDLCAR